MIVEAREITFRDLGILAGYSTSENDLLDDFYVPVVSRAIRYDRAVGYFTSGLMALAALAYADFVDNGGRLRLICSPFMTENDTQRLDTSNSTGSSRDEIVQNLRVLASANNIAGALTTVMSSLLAAGVLEIKFGTPTMGRGLFHDKLGIFKDQAGDRISFVGSANETASAWSGLANHEQIETFCSWEGDDQGSRVVRHERRFEELWNNVVRGVEVRTASASAAIVYESAPPIDVDEALQNIRDLIARHRKAQPGALSGRRVLREHQREVLDDWEFKGNRGLVAFATGGWEDPRRHRSHQALAR